ncbi:DUF58 domain-containing protein [Microbacterium sp.]|uniref:DUF58 domain-containing protein n=1 Tax=Microbacterium sp. TaxID=51671 RepID=UPI003C72D786
MSPFARWPLTARGTGAALLAVLCFVLAHQFGIPELSYLSVLLALGVAASIATLYVVRRTERVTRAFVPDVAAAGQDVLVRLRVEVRSPLPGAQGRWHDRLPDGMSGDAGGVFPQTSSGMRRDGRAVTLEYAATALRRGILPVGPLSLVSTDPFGFARRRHLVGAPVPLTVTPLIAKFGAIADQPGEAGGSLRTTTDRLGQGTDNLVPRHYLPGDSMRRIHWRASAHRDELMVRQEEQETTPEAIVVLDRGVRRWAPEAARTPGADPGFEVAVSACVSAASRLVQEGYVVSVLDVDGTLLHDPIEGGDATGVELLAIGFATVTARRDAPVESLVAALAGATTGPLVLVTGAIDEADAAALAAVPHHSSLPVLMSVSATRPALVRAAETGWRVASIPPGVDLSVAWSSVVDRGGSRVGA